MMMERLVHLATMIRHWGEYLTGRTDERPASLPLPAASPWWGVWWGILLLVVLTFCGQSSKFIYIDF